MLGGYLKATVEFGLRHRGVKETGIERFNDLYGHAKGDEVLAAIVECGMRTGGASLEP